MTINFVHEGSLEFLSALSYYDNQNAGLGRRLKDEVTRTMRWLRKIIVYLV